MSRWRASGRGCAITRAACRDERAWRDVRGADARNERVRARAVPGQEQPHAHAMELFIFLLKFDREFAFEIHFHFEFGHAFLS